MIIIISEDHFIRDFNNSHAGQIHSAYLMNRKVLSYSQFGSVATVMKMYIVRHEIIAVLLLY